MRNLFLLLFIGMLLTTSCNDGTDIERSEEYMNIYIPMVQEKESTLQNVPVVNNTVNFLSLDRLNFEQDTLLQLGVYCGGMSLPTENIELEFALATDSLASLQKKNVPQARYTLLPETYYTVDSWKVTIPAGQANGYLRIALKTKEIPSNSKYILPLCIKSTTKYTIDSSKYFILFGITR